MNTSLFDAPAIPPHPARYPRAVLQLFTVILEDHAPGRRLRVLDPFAGTGRIHRLNHDTIGVELETEWARSHHRTINGDATRLPFPAGSFQAVATSPAYGNRMADAYDGRDGSERHTYRIDLGRPLSPGSGAALQWGPAYRDLHQQAWNEAHRILEPGGLILVNIADHIRNGEHVPVVGWHTDALAAAGFTIHDCRHVPTSGIRHGANHDARTDGEVIVIATKGDRHAAL